MSGRQEHLRPLESCTRPYGPTGDFHQFARFTAEELIQNLFWAAGPADAGWHWHRAVSTWSFPSLCHKLAHQNNLKDIYAIWQNMPLAVDPPARGHHSAEKGRLKLQRHTAIRKEVKTFAPIGCGLMAAPIPRNGEILGRPILSHPYAALCHGIAPCSNP